MSVDNQCNIVLTLSGQDGAHIMDPKLRLMEKQLFLLLVRLYILSFLTCGVKKSDKKYFMPDYN